MTKAHLHGMSADGTWRPIRVSTVGEISSGGVEWSYAAAGGGITDTSDVVLKAAGGFGVSNYLTSLQICNTSNVATEVVIKDGSTVIWRCKVGASMISPATIEFPKPLVGSANTALNAACITTSSATYINAQGYQDAPSASFQGTLTTQVVELLDGNGNSLVDGAGNALYVPSY